MEYPTIKAVSIIGRYTLLVIFSNNDKRIYDVSPLLDREIFFALKNPVFFKNVRIDSGGFALTWGKDTDISEYEIWVHGTPA